MVFFLRYFLSRKSNCYCPKELPQSCLTMAPRFDQLNEVHAKEIQIKESSVHRKPLIEVNPPGDIIAVSVSKKKEVRLSLYGSSSGPLTATQTATACQRYLRQLHTQLKEVFQKKVPILPDVNAEEMSDPAAQPFVWISKWVDYSDKYGFGYQLCDDGVGVMFNDSTKLILLANQRNVHYVDKDGTENYYVMGETPPTLEKKMKLLSYFRRYMNEHLMKAGAAIPIQEADSLSRIPYLNLWHRSSSAVVMQLTNGTVQVNFISDHTKIIMCPLMGAVTYIDSSRNFRTYRFNTIATNGCVENLLLNLEYAYKKIGAMLDDPHVS